MNWPHSRNHPLCQVGNSCQCSCMHSTPGPAVQQLDLVAECPNLHTHLVFSYKQQNAAWLHHPIVVGKTAGHWLAQEWRCSSLYCSNSGLQVHSHKWGSTLKSRILLPPCACCCLMSPTFLLAQGNVVQLSAMCKVDLCHVRLPNVGSGLVRPKFSKPKLVGPVQVRFEP